MPTGVLVSGVCIGCDSVRDKDGYLQSVIAVAVGMDVMRIYMAHCLDSSIPFGTDVIVKCRCYAGRSGRVIWVDGEIVT